MIYHSPGGRAYHRRFVLVVDLNDGMPIVDGIYEDYATAVGEMMLSIWEFRESYKDDGDIFEIGELEDGNNGDFITIKFQSHNWEHPCEETYMILYCDERAREHDKPKKGEKQ